MVAQLDDGDGAGGVCPGAEEVGCEAAGCGGGRDVVAVAVAVAVAVVVVVDVVIVVLLASRWSAMGSSRSVGSSPKQGPQRWEVQGEEDEAQGGCRKKGAWRNGDAEEAHVGVDREK